MRMFAAISPPTLTPDLFTITPPASATASFTPPVSPHNVNLPPLRVTPMSRENPHTPDSKRPTRPPPSSSASSPFIPSSSPAQVSSPSSSSSFYAQRYASTVQNPAGRIAHRALSRDKRRGQFLNRIKNGRDEATFDARAEQMQRMECLTQKREFLERMARSAPDFGYVEEEEEDHDDEGNQQRHRDWSGRQESEQMNGHTRTVMMSEEQGGYSGNDEDALEQLISEEQEFQAFIEEMEKTQVAGQTRDMPYEDDDYDNLFTNLVTNGDNNGSASHDDMDTSHG